MNNTHSTSIDGEKSILKHEQICLAQAKLMLQKFRARTLSPARAGVAAQLITAIQRLERTALFAGESAVAGGRSAQ